MKLPEESIGDLLDYDAKVLDSKWYAGTLSFVKCGFVEVGVLFPRSTALTTIQQNWNPVIHTDSTLSRNSATGVGAFVATLRTITSYC